MFGFFLIGKSEGKDAALDELNKATREWTMKAARGECEWICADCSCSFPGGMPDQCLHGHSACTEIIKRDKAKAASADTEGNQQ